VGRMADYQELDGLKNTDRIIRMPVIKIEI
jgi:hypothetical protein